MVIVGGLGECRIRSPRARWGFERGEVVNDCLVTNCGARLARSAGVATDLVARIIRGHL